MSAPPCACAVPAHTASKKGVRTLFSVACIQPEYQSALLHCDSQKRTGRGLWADFQGVDGAIERFGDVEVVDAWMKKASLGETLGTFPASYDDLLG